MSALGLAVSEWQLPLLAGLRQGVLPEAGIPVIIGKFTGIGEYSSLIGLTQTHQLSA